MDRRQFHIAALAALLAASRAQAGTPEGPPQGTPSRPATGTGHDEAMNRYASLLGHPKATIGMLVYPGMFLQDLVGPLSVFESLMNRDIHLLWKNLDPIGQGDGTQRGRVAVLPTTPFAQCTAQLDVLFVPGGVPGTYAMMEDKEVLGFLADKGKTARYVTSVCTGSLILGAAGLLQGYKATSYWSARDSLKELGAIPTPGRIVVDRNRITGGGVTAGLDFALKLAGLLTSDLYAQAIQLYLEYDPQPPFNAGSPEKAPPEALAFLNDMFADSVQQARDTARRAGKRRAGSAP